MTGIKTIFAVVSFQYVLATSIDGADIKTITCENGYKVVEVDVLPLVGFKQDIDRNLLCSILNVKCASVEKQSQNVNRKRAFICNPR